MAGADHPRAAELPSHIPPVCSAVLDAAWATLFTPGCARGAPHAGRQNRTSLLAWGTRRCSDDRSWHLRLCRDTPVTRCDACHVCCSGFHAPRCPNAKLTAYVFVACKSRHRDGACMSARRPACTQDSSVSGWHSRHPARVRGKALTRPSRGLLQAVWGPSHGIDPPAVSSGSYMAACGPSGYLNASSSLRGLVKETVLPLLLLCVAAHGRRDGAPPPRAGLQHRVTGRRWPCRLPALQACLERGCMHIVSASLPRLLIDAHLVQAHCRGEARAGSAPGFLLLP